MCDFHSVIVTNDGRILHKPSNSHSGIAMENGLAMGLDAPWFECEWNGVGDMPTHLVQTRNRTIEPTQVAYRAAEAHYRKLALVLSGDLPANTPPFDTPDYEDVRQQVTVLANERESDRVFAVISADLEERGFDGAGIMRLCDRLLDEFGSSKEEYAADEIEQAREDAAEWAREDMYTREDMEDARDEARSEGYDEGYDEGKEQAEEDFTERLKEAIEEAREEWDAEHGLPRITPMKVTDDSPIVAALYKIPATIADNCGDGTFRYSLDAVHACPANDGYNYLTATDGAQMAIVKVRGNLSARPVMIPAQCCREGTVNIRESGNVESASYLVPLVDGRFPGATTALPDATGYAALGINASILSTLAATIGNDDCLTLLLPPAQNGRVDGAIGAIGENGFGAIMPRTDAYNSADYELQRAEYVKHFVRGEV